MPDAEVRSRLEKLAAEIEALHDTMGVLIDDVAELKLAIKMVASNKVMNRWAGQRRRAR